MKNHALTLFLLLGASGCAHTERVAVLRQSDGAATPSIGVAEAESINRAAGGRHSLIELADGHTVAGTRVRVGPDSVSWTEPRTGIQRREPLREVAAITVLRRGQGAVRGLLLGALAGAVAGYALERATDTGPESQRCGTDADLCLSRGDAAALAGGLGGIFGAALGAPAGALWGYQMRFVLTRPDQRQVAGSLQRMGQVKDAGPLVRAQDPP